MSTREVTEQNFEATVKEGLVLLDFWAAWCGPCRAFAPIFEAAAERHPGVVFGKIDTEAQQGLAAAFQIRSIPTLMAIRDGVVLFMQPGMLKGPALDDLIRQAQALDMDEVRREISEKSGEKSAEKSAETSEKLGSSAAAR